MSEQWLEYKDLVELIDINRITWIIDELSKKTDTPGEGVTRLAYSEMDILGKNFVGDLMVEAGLEVNVSPIGNTIGHLGKLDNPAVMIGSHTDSVKRGGAYDGIVGIATAIEVSRVLNQVKDNLHYPVEVIDFAMEEASRFGAVRALGSYVFSGGEVTESKLRTLDESQIMIADALQMVKKLKYYKKSNLNIFSNSVAEAQYSVQQSRRTPDSLRAFIELHVEQGQVLEEAKIHIGIITGAAAPIRLLIELTGQQSHSGTTPMHKRKNALCAASEIVLYVDAVCTSKADSGIVGAITKLIVEPNSVNTVPGKCFLTLDLRGTNKDIRQDILIDIKDYVNLICNQRGIKVSIENLVEENPISFSSSIITATEASCGVLDITSCHIPSRAGHDACDMTRLIPNVGMIFVPSKGGVSHNPAEWTDPNDIHLGAKVLLLTILQLALN